MTRRDLGGDEAGLRPERLGGSLLGLRSERLGEAAGDRPAAARGDGWTHDEAGTTAGRMYRFESPAEMQAFVADVQGTLDRLATRRRGGADGAVTLLVFLAAHRISS